jgi:hypothetical protein
MLLFPTSLPCPCSDAHHGHSLPHPHSHAPLPHLPSPPPSPCSPHPPLFPCSPSPPPFLCTPSPLPFPIPIHPFPTPIPMHCKVHIRVARANRHCATTFGRLRLLPPRHLHSTSTLIILVCVRVRPPYCTCIAPFVSCGSSLMYLSPGSCARNGTSLSPLILAALSYSSDTSA